MTKSIYLPWTRWLILLFLVSLFLAVAPEPTDTVAVRTFQQGEQLSAAGAPGQVSRTAEAAYQDVIARRPLDPQPWRQLGDLYAARGRLDDALYAYGQAIRRGDDGAALDRSLAQLYAAVGNYRQSARRWADYLARRPDDRAARLILAQIAIRLADWERARAELEHLLGSDPADPVVHAWLGLLLIGPDPMTAMPHLQRAADDPAMAAFLAPVFAAERRSAASDDPAYRSALLGVAFLDLDLSTLRQHSVRRYTLDAGTKLLEATFNRAAAQATSTLALRSLLAATYRNPAYADAYAYLGQAFDRLGWPGWARASLGYALHLAPQSPIVLTLTGLYWDRHGAPKLARHYYQAAYNQDQDSAALCLEIAATYAAEREYTAAEVWLLFAAEIAPDAPQVWEMLARFYLESGIGVAESGLPAAARLLQLAPNDPRAHDLMGWAYFLTGDDAGAEARLNQALSLDATLASAHYHLGRLRARQGRYAEATQAYRQATDYDIEGQLTAELDRAWKDLPQTQRE